MKKQNKRNQFTRITLALLLILSMLGNTLILPAVAQESAMPADEPALPETPTTGEADTDSTTPTLPEPILLTAADVPEFISAAALAERGAVERMRSEETNMSSVIFRNSDGTRTMYMYGLPVKYTAADGTVRDKSTNLVSVSAAAALLSDQPVAETMAQMSTAQQTALQAELGILDAERAADTLHMLSTALTARGSSLSDMAYTTLDNDVYALFPTNLTEGMTLVFGEHSLRMTPATGMTMTAGGNVTKTTTASLSDADVTERLLYPNVFGPGTAVQYTPTLTGVKEEILLSYNVGKNSFDFLLETDGLVLTETNGQFVLVNPETEQQVGKLGEIIVFDSAGQIIRGQMTAQTIKNGQIYGVTVSVDEEFLASATYPVSIDPTAYMDPVKDDYEYGECVLIEDVGVYSHEDAWGWTFEDFHVIGDVSNYDDHVGEAVYRFPLLYDPNVLSECYNLTSDQIYSFRLQLATYANESQTGNTWYANLYRASWDSSSRICDPAYYSDYDTSLYNIPITNIPANGTFYIDLTPIAHEWADMLHGVSSFSDSTPTTGVVLRNSDISKRCVVYAVGHSTQIHVVIDYGDPIYNGMFYFNSLETRRFMGTTDNSSVKLLSGRVSNIGSQIAWKIAYHGDNRYSFHPNGNMNLYLDGYADIESGTVDSDGYWYITSVIRKGVILTSCDTGYVLMSDIDGTVIAIPGENYSNDIKCWRMVSVDNYKEASIDTASIDLWLAPEEQYDIFQNLNLGNWHFVSKEDFNISVLTTSVASLADTTITAIEPNGFTNIGVHHIPTGKTKLITLRVTPLVEGVYFFRNVLIGKYVQIAQGEAPDYDEHGAALEAWDFDGGDHQQWAITRVEDEYYSIISNKSGMAVTVQEEDVNVSGYALAQEIYYGLDRQLWKFSISQNGTYVIQPKSAEGSIYDFCMAINCTTTNGTNITQEMYDSNVNYRDEWYLLQSDFHINVLYDHAYLDRYSNRVNNIESDMLTIHERFFAEFGFFVTYTEPMLFTSLADECIKDPDEGCECGPCVNSSYNEVTSLHHKNVYNVLYNLPEPQSKRYGVLAYIGHDLCENDEEGEHVSAGYLGMASYVVNKAIVMNPKSDAQVLRTTLHEIGHWFDAPDHYDDDYGDNDGIPTTEEMNGENPEGPFSMACIYGERKHWGLVTGDLVICQGCHNTISEYINDHYRGEQQ